MVEPVVHENTKAKRNPRGARARRLFFFFFFFFFFFPQLTESMTQATQCRRAEVCGIQTHDESPPTILSGSNEMSQFASRRTFQCLHRGIVCHLSPGSQGSGLVLFAGDYEKWSGTSRRPLPSRSRPNVKHSETRQLNESSTRQLLFSTVTPGNFIKASRYWCLV
jgi:hypothetical protein